MSAFSQYLDLRPVGLKSKVHVYAAFLKGFFAKKVSPKKFITIGQFLRSDCIVRYDSMLFYARSHSEDIGYYAHTTKPDTFHWFKPASGETVVDCGSSVGLFTIIGLKNGSEVYAFEPNPSTFAILRKNIDMNGFGNNAHIFNLGLSNEPGEMTLYAPNHFTGITSFEQKWVENLADKDKITELKVKVTTPDHMLANVKKIDWLLIDVESFEYRLLLGSNNTLNKTDKIIIEISNRNREKVKKLLADHGFIETENGNEEESVQYYLYKRT
jgi:FkbM family methyltransferase